MGAVPTRSPTHEPANEAMTTAPTAPLPPLLAASRGDTKIVPVLASAPGKAILFGEHAVVYGKTAIATAVDLRSYVLLYPTPSARAVTIVFPDIQFRVAVPLESLAAFTHAPSPTTAPRDLDPDRRAALTAIIKAQCPDVLPTQLAAALAVLHVLLELCGDTVPPFTLVLRSEIPVGSGLGSSASLSVALAVAMLAGFGVVGCSQVEEVGAAKRKRARTTSEEVATAKDDKKEAMLRTVNAWAFASEKVIHGNPSGVDNTVVTYGGSLAYTKGAGMVPLTGCAAFEFLLTNTLVEKNTKIQVDKVRHRRDLLPTVIDPVLDAMHHLATTAQSLLTAETADLSPLIHVNQTLLAALDASHPAIDNVVALTSAHGLPSKLTGAGGGGCVMTYVPPGTPAETVDLAMADLRGAGFDTFKTQVGGMGVALHRVAADAPVARVGEKRARDDADEEGAEVKDWDQWMARFEKPVGDHKICDHLNTAVLGAPIDGAMVAASPASLPRKAAPVDVGRRVDEPFPPVSSDRPHNDSAWRRASDLDGWDHPVDRDVPMPMIPQAPRRTSPSQPPSPRGSDAPRSPSDAAPYVPPQGNATSTRPSSTPGPSPFAVAAAVTPTATTARDVPIPTPTLSPADESMRGAESSRTSAIPSETPAPNPLFVMDIRAVTAWSSAATVGAALGATLLLVIMKRYGWDGVHSHWTTPMPAAAPELPPPPPLARRESVASTYYSPMVGVGSLEAATPPIDLTVPVPPAPAPAATTNVDRAPRQFRSWAAYRLSDMPDYDDDGSVVSLGREFRVW
ncbi:mevalonate kinase [Allomyces macrogynus ATCC 38327]|uniref:mevalonate kinase n=1 Tax=Allomyces macrogynus (strain ATCC 38327) TaxID=578462 RepID=A0A0L0T4G8_ALLM3|nr:mevalonate kinase [Allomyces macrogynus ATCC 38327]|eukprot:KNE69615.1 mevalonate kinase [Allomyces macrogynus ATCC 38327]